MGEIEILVKALRDPDNRRACAALKELQAESERSGAVYPYFDRFAAMLDDGNSYIRTRGLLLVAANAGWDTAHRLDDILDKFLTHITDDKPITARQCIGALPALVRARPDLRGRIRKALLNADASPYADSMRPLVEQDIAAAVSAIG